MNEPSFISFKNQLSRSVKKGAECLNEKFKEKYNTILYEDYRSNFSLNEIKNIIIGCIQYSEIEKLLSNEEKELLNIPKILKHKYFVQCIDLFDELIEKI